MSASVQAQRVLQKGEPEGFQTAAEAAKTAAIAPVGAGDLVIAPELTIVQAKALWNSYLDFKNLILDDPDCADDIGGKREMNRTGATRLATAFGLSLRIVEIHEGRVEDAETHDYDYRFLVRASASKGSRCAEGLASCRLSEIPASTRKGEPVPYSQREHFALTKAATRATKRAIADILGGTEAE